MEAIKSVKIPLTNRFSFDDPDVVLVSDECGRNDGKPVNRVINEKIDMLCCRIPFNNFQYAQKKDTFSLHLQDDIPAPPA